MILSSAGCAADTIALMTTVTLSALLQARDESLRVARTPAWRKALSWVRRIDIAPLRRALLVALLAAFGFTTRHALVVAGLGALVAGAATVSPLAAWLTAGVSLLFLEVRRR